MKLIESFLVLLLLFTFPISAFSAPSEEDLKKVVALAETAAISYDKGEYGKALSLYQKAHALWASPKLSFGIIKCLEAQKKYNEALAVAKRGLAERPRAVLKARLESKVKFLKEQLSKGKLALKIIPTGADVQIDGKSVGKTPVDVQSLSAGSHELKIIKGGYATVVQGISISGGATLKLSFALQATTGKVSITSVPSGAKVQIDGKSWGKTPVGNVRLSIGSHFIQVKLAEHNSVSRQIQVKGAENENVAFALSKTITELGPWYQSWPAWATFGVAITAALGGAAILSASGSMRAKLRKYMDDPSSTKTSQKEIQEDWDRTSLPTILGPVLLGSSVVLAALTVVLFVKKVGVAPKETSRQSSNFVIQNIQRADTTLLLVVE